MEQIIKINPASNLGSISFLKNDIAIIEEFKQNGETNRTNFYLKNGMAITVEGKEAPETFADAIYKNTLANELNFNVKAARVKRAERTLSFQL